MCYNFCVLIPQYEGQKLTLLEAGCGVGNCLFPLLEEELNLFAYACDFSPRAVDYVKVGAPYMYSAACFLMPLSSRVLIQELTSHEHHGSRFLLPVHVKIFDSKQSRDTTKQSLCLIHMAYFVGWCLIACPFKIGYCDQDCIHASQNSQAQSSVMSNGGNRIP